MMVSASRKARSGPHAASLERSSFAPFARTSRPASRSSRNWGLEPACRLYFRGLPRRRQNRDVASSRFDHLPALRGEEAFNSARQSFPHRYEIKLHVPVRVRSAPPPGLARGKVEAQIHVARLVVENDF